MTDVTRILNAIDQGDEKATEELLPLVYEELRLLATQKMARERPGQTLQASEQPFDVTMQYLRHGEHAYVLVNRSKTLPTTYPELAECQGRSCRLLRHST